MSNVGKIVQIVGPIVDVRFKQNKLPDLLTALNIVRENGEVLVVEVSQHIGDDLVRCVSMGPTEGLVRNMDVIDTGAPIKIPVGRATLGRMFNVLGEPIDEKPAPKVKKYMPIHRLAPSYEEQKSSSEVLRPLQW